MAAIPRILIVEDDEIISNLIAVLLEKKGYCIVGKVASGEEAIARAVELEPDLILMDINLSGILDGVTAARYIFHLFHFPVIFLTAHCDDKLLDRRAKCAQPYGYILKPFTDKELASNVQLALYNHGIRKKFFDSFPVGDPKKIVSALEAVLITDVKGRVIFCNPYAMMLFEVPEQQILMSNWKNSISLVNDQTQEPVEDPVPQVVSQMLVVIHEFNTEIVTRTGKHRKVGVTARPIKDDCNDLLGVFIHFKEKSLDQIKMAKRY
jgi:CheY-like chemotaxis protein